MRLIDADEILKRWNELSPRGRTEFDQVIMCMSTAYDVDKVVKKLEKLKKAEQHKDDECDEDGYGDAEQIFSDGVSQGKFEAFGKAIEILRGGGTE